MLWCSAVMAAAWDTSRRYRQLENNEIGTVKLNFYLHRILFTCIQQNACSLLFLILPLLRFVTLASFYVAVKTTCKKRWRMLRQVTGFWCIIHDYGMSLVSIWVWKGCLHLRWMQEDSSTGSGLDSWRLSWYTRPPLWEQSPLGGQ